MYNDVKIETFKSDKFITLKRSKMKFYCVYTNNRSPFQDVKGRCIITKFYDSKLADECKKELEDEHKDILNKKMYMYNPVSLSDDEYPKEGLKFWIEYL